jgi:hypothetical protein
MKKTFLISVLTLAAFSMYAQSADQQTTTSYNGAVCKRFPNMPAGATPVWPKGAYTPTQDASCPPCYEYTSKHGVRIMECPYLQFPPEHATAAADAGVAPVTAAQPTGDLQVQSQNSYTGNYPVCKRDPDMPANAKPVWPKGEYTPLEAQACAPCYEYKSKRTGIMIMECPFLRFPAEH